MTSTRYPETGWQRRTELVRRRRSRTIRIMLAGVLVVLATGLAGPANAATVSVVDAHGITYQADDTNVAAGATVTSYHFPGDPQVTIPSTITIKGVDYAVTAIGDGAFSANFVADVVIPDSVTTIGSYAFSGNDMATLVIPDSVTTIGSYAFAANLLTSVVIPDSVTTIGGSAFAGNSLTEVEIPDSVTAINDGTFSTNKLTAVVIPDSVTDIGGSAFSGNYLTAVVIPDSVTSIAGSAFSYNALTSVTIPESVTTLGNYAFEENALTSVVIPGSITSIGDGTFFNNALTTVSIPGSVTSIGDRAFSDNALTTVSIPDSVTKIGGGAFVLNDGLVRVEFAGPAPAAFVDAGPFGSFGTGDGLVVAYQWEYDASNLPGGFAMPSWRGYATQTVKPVHTVTFDTGGHGDPIPVVDDVTHGDAIITPADPVATGWIFTGWHTTLGSATAYDFSNPVTDDLILYAGWTAVTDPGSGGGPHPGGENSSNPSNGSGDNRGLPDTGSWITAALLATALSAIVAGIVLARRKA